ncbi:MAG: hypothetical protein MUO26_10510 [Methanotrichaceae archaeon]|nr:hypothetical protein [Methanotrichaceae archaeon]
MQKEVAEHGDLPPFDKVRRKYLTSIFDNTGRNTILYATMWTQPPPMGNIDPQLISITEEDVQGLMEVIHGVKGSELDLILHSPGGSIEATEAIVSYLRSKFSDIRVIIPQASMSAATMLACSSNIIVMGNHSSLGPIDPQFILQTPLGSQMVPAQAILDQFNLAKSECSDPKNLGPWLPILNQYGPALLVQCKNALDLSEKLVSEWLESYMFAGKENAKKTSKKIAHKLSNHKFFKSHGRHINREQAFKLGLNIEALEKDQAFQDLILSGFHATTHTFQGTGAVKIIENHKGKAFIKFQQRIMVQQTPFKVQPPAK